MVSIVDVAREAGVSQATVSRVLGGKVRVNVETRDRVLNAVASLGYRPNAIGKALRAGQSKIVALLISDIAQGWYAALAKELQLAFEARGYDILLFDTGHSEQRLRSLLARSQSLWLGGLILATSDRLDTAALAPDLEQLRQLGVSLLSIGQDLSRLDIASVPIDNRCGARDAVAHLVARGCRRIAYLNRLSQSVPGQERFEGYLSGLADAGLSREPDLFWEATKFRFEGGYEAAARAVDAGIACDAILAGTDELALGAIAALQDRGKRVPEDMAVVAFGGLPFATYTRPSLTTLHVDVAIVAQAAVQRLLEPDAPRIPPIRRELVVRQSA